MKFCKCVKKYINIFIAVVILIGVTGFFSACNKQKEGVYNGIPLVNEQAQEYSTETKNFANSVLNEMLLKIYKACVNENPSQNTKDLLSTHATEIIKIAEKQGLSEKTYNQLFQTLSDNSTNYALAFANVQSNSHSENDIAILKKCLSTISSYVGINTTATIIYNFSDYYYGYLHQKYMQEYEQYGWGYKLADANKVLEDRKTLTEDITLKNFIPTVKLSFFMGELLLGGLQSSSAINNLTSAEILLLLKAPDFSEINMSTKAWKLVLSQLLNFTTSGSYHSGLTRKFYDNNDLDTLANKMQDFIALICSVQNNFTEAHADMLSNGDKNGFIKQCFMLLTNDDWAKFENLTSLNFDTKYYNDYAIEFYGEKYSEYYTSIQKVSILDLKTAVNGEDFEKVLKNYFVGIFPAWFYGATI